MTAQAQGPIPAMQFVVLALALAIVPEEPKLEEVPASAAETLELRFDWPEFGSVLVHEETLKKGRNSVTRFRLHWGPTEDGEGTLLSHTDFAFTSFAGLSPEDPRIVDAIRSASVLGSAVPDMRLDDEGYLVELLNYQEIVLDLISVTAEFIEPAAWQKLRPILESPETHAALEIELAENWNLWVANWIGLDVERGTQQVWRFDMDENGSAVPEIEVEIGSTSEYRGVPCVEIMTTAVADEDRLLRMTLERLGLWNKAMGAEIPAGSPFDRMTRVQKTHGFYSLDGLRPIEVESAMELSAWLPDKLAPMLEVEQHRFVFDWEDLAAPDPMESTAPAAPAQGEPGG